MYLFNAANFKEHIYCLAIKQRNQYGKTINVGIVHYSVASIAAIKISVMVY